MHNRDCMVTSSGHNAECSINLFNQTWWVHGVKNNRSVIGHVTQLMLVQKLYILKLVLTFSADYILELAYIFTC